MKMSETFEIRVNILKILRNKQTQKIVRTYPKAGVSCYTLYRVAQKECDNFDS